MKASSNPPGLLVTLGFFLASITCLAMSVWMIIGLYIVHEVREAQGNVVLDASGQPVFIIDHWRTWLVNWRAHTWMAAAVVFFCIPVVHWLLHLWRAHIRKSIVVPEKL